MTIKYTCSCGRAYFFRDRMAGRRVRCQACGAEAVLPEPGAAAQPGARKGDGGAAGASGASEGGDVSATPSVDPRIDLPAADLESAEALSGMVFEDDTAPHLRQSMRRAEALRATPRERTVEGFVAVAIATVGMVSVVLGLGACVAGVAHMVRHGLDGLALGSVAVLLGWAVGVGGGLAMIALGGRGALGGPAGEPAERS